MYLLYSAILSTFSFLISVTTLVLFFRNRRTSLQLFSIHREKYRSSSIHLKHVKTIETDNDYIIHFILFNPGDVAAVINSVTIREAFFENKFLEFLKISSLKPFDLARWWPTNNPDDYEIKYFCDEYQNLYVDDKRDILVSFPKDAFDHKKSYQIDVKTNNGHIWMPLRFSLLRSGKSSFPYSISY